jgi:hypothetical protein
VVPVRTYKAFWEYVAQQVPGFNHVFLVDDEPELKNHIGTLADRDTILVAVYPNADLAAVDEDNLGDVDTCVVYVLMKIEPRNVTEEEQMDERALTQQLMKQIRQFMFFLEGQWDNQTDHSRLMKQLVRGKQHVDRERNYFGCNGYSLSFGLKTNGL